MEHHIRVAEAVTFLLEGKFTILGRSFGLDPLLGLIPWLGDFIGLLFALYLVWIGLQMKLPEVKLRAMVKNVILDFVIGVIPFVGSIGDFFFKSNTKNLRILKDHAITVREAYIVTS